MLYRDTTYYYTSDDTFSHALENVQFFVMESYEIGMHKQEFFEINIVVKGSGSHHIEKNEIPAVVGDVFIIPPEMEHGYTGGEGFDVYHILVSNRFIERNITELEQIPGFSMLFSLEPMIRARVKSGMENAKAKGKRVGRRPTTKDDIPSIFHKHYAAFRDGKMNVSELARVCGISSPTVYKYLKII